jgi:hypothetical protein
MYLRRKCYSSASNYGYNYITPAERLYSFCKEDLLMRMFSDDNRGLGTAIGAGVGGLGLAGLYGYARHKDSKAEKNLASIKAGLSKAERAAWGIPTLGSATKNGEVINGIVGKLAGATNESEMREVLQGYAKNGGNLKDLQGLLDTSNDITAGLRKAKSSKNKSLEDAIIENLYEKDSSGNRTDKFVNLWKDNFKSFNKDAKNAFSKKNREVINKSLDYIAAEELEQNHKKLADLEKLMATYGGDDKVPESVKQDYLKTQAAIRSTEDSMNLRSLGNVEGYKKKISASEKDVKNTLLKRLRANKKMAAAAGIGGLAGLAGLGYMAGDNR